jgi:hypothetical protein
MGRMCGRYDKENTLTKRVLVRKPEGKRQGRKYLNNIKMDIKGIG